MSDDITAEARLYRWRFDHAEFDEARLELHVGGLAVDVEQKPLQVLAVLLRHAGEVVTKRELFDAVWSGRVTVDHVLATAVSKLRKALGDNGEALISTLPRVGYRLEGRVERVAVGRRHASALQLAAGQPVPGREHFLLERQLGASKANEVWFAQQPKTREPRVFKFSADGTRLAALKREATLSRVLHEHYAGGAFVRVLDWNFETAPFFLECEYGGLDLLAWSAANPGFAGWPQPRRIELFLRIADAVAEAHGVGILHKDLKPANVLIAEEAEGARIRLTDFGSSRLLEPERLAELGITELGLTVTQNLSGDSSSGTPLYLAPELIAGEAPTVRSDVYALGVLLYQFAVGDLRRPIAPGWEHDIDDALLRQDIARATDGHPARRLSSAAELAERLRGLEARHAEHERQRIEAARAQELQRRLERDRARRPWLIALAASLVAGLGLSLWLYASAERERRHAVQEAARAEAIADFLNDDILGGASPGKAGFEKNPSIRDLLDTAASQLGTRFADSPSTRGAVLAALGRAYFNVGARDRGAPYFREAAQLQAQAFGEDDARTLQTRYRLVRSLAFAATAEAFTEAEALIDATDAAAAGRIATPTPLALQAALARADYHFQRLQIEPALQALRRAESVQPQVAPDDAYEAFRIRYMIADGLLRLGRLAEGEAQARALLDGPLAAAPGVGVVMRANLQVILARALRGLARYDEALVHAQDAASAVEDSAGADAYAAILASSTIASIHAMAGRCDLALPVQRSVYERSRKRNGDAAKSTLYELGNLGFKEYECGSRETGLRQVADVEHGLREQFGAQDPGAQSFRYFLVKAHTEAGDYEAALALLEGLDAGILAAAESSPGWEHRLAATRGLILVRSGHGAEGRALLAPAVQALAEIDADDDALAEWRQALAGEASGI